MIALLSILKYKKFLGWGIFAIAAIVLFSFYEIKIHQIENRIKECKADYEILQATNANLNQALQNQNDQILANANNNNADELTKQIDKMKEETRKQIIIEDKKMKTCNDVLQQYYKLWNSKN